MATRIYDLDSARALFPRSAGRVRVAYAFNPDRAGSPPRDQSDGWVGGQGYATYATIERLHRAGFTVVALEASGTHERHDVAISRLVSSFIAASSRSPWSAPVRLPIEDALRIKPLSSTSWEVFDGRFAKGANREGRHLGFIRQEPDGTFTPTGEGAMFGGKREGCESLEKAMQVFIGFD